MTPKEKAIELVECFAESIKPVTFGVLMERDWKSAKQCALIAVDLLISETFLDFYVTHPKPFWEEVKTELENP